VPNPTCEDVLAITLSLRVEGDMNARRLAERIEKACGSAVQTVIEYPASARGTPRSEKLRKGQYTLEPERAPLFRRYRRFPPPGGRGCPNAVDLLRSLLLQVEGERFRVREDRLR